MKKRDRVSDVDRVMSDFFATATDDEFWAELEAAGWAEFSRIDAPVVDYHTTVASYQVTATGMSARSSSFWSSGSFESIAHTSRIVGGSLVMGSDALLTCDQPTEAANSNELALAA